LSFDPERFADRAAGELHVWPEGVTREGGDTVVSAALELAGQPRDRLWYRVPAGLEPHLTESADPFAVGLILYAMERRVDLVIHGAVSTSLLENLAEFQQPWRAWGRGRRAEIRVDTQKEQEPAPGAAAVSAFTGGVDSSFTVLRHRRRLAKHGHLDVQAGLFVHGFDVPLAHADAYDRAAARAERTLASVGVSLVRMASNHKVLNPDWDQTHGVGIASCLMLLGRRFRYGLIPATYGYAGLVLPWGSNPLTDPLLSSAAFRIVHDGAAFGRGAKLSLVSHWPEAVESLRVCWKARRRDENCGRCAKCVLTALGFRIRGLDVPPSLSAGAGDVASIRGMGPLDANELRDLHALLEASRARGIAAPWLPALERCARDNARRLARSQRERGGLTGGWRRLRLRWQESRRRRLAPPG
jgi:hypothetical protein